MNYIFRHCDRIGRSLILLGAVSVYLCIEITNSIRDFFIPIDDHRIIIWKLFSFGLYSLISFIFLVIGSLIWLYALKRFVAHFLFAFSVVMMVVFASLANIVNDVFFI